MQNKTHVSPNRPLAMLLKLTHMLGLIVLGGMTLVVAASAQSAEAPNTKTGRILGTVVDTSDDPIPGATVFLHGPTGDRLTVVTKDDGAFVFDQAPAEIAYQVTVTAEGFADWSSSITVEPGQDKTLSDVKLRILAVQRAVTVSYSSKEVAAQQLRAEEQQRVFAFHTESLCDLRTSPRASYHEHEVPPGIQKPHQSVFLRPHGCVGWRPTGS